MAQCQGAPAAARRDGWFSREVPIGTFNRGGCCKKTFGGAKKRLAVVIAKKRLKRLAVVIAKKRLAVQKTLGGGCCKKTFGGAKKRVAVVNPLD